MKKLFFALICLSIGSISANAQSAPQSKDAMPAAAAANPNAPEFKFKGGDTHDFGELPEGPDAVYKFEFTNAGKEPLIIQNASGSCGCTIPDWPKSPILPGKKGDITVTYHTAGRVGPFTKDVYIQSNAKSGKERYELHIKGTVKAKAPEATTGAAKS